MARTIAKDHDEKRLLILQTAAKVFAKDGFDRASINVLSKACNFSKAAIYHYYNSKEQILFDILALHLNEIKDLLENSSRASEETAEDYLSRMILEILILYKGRENEHQILMNTSTVNNLESHYRSTIIKYQKDIIAVISTFINDIEPGVFEQKPSHLRYTTMSLFAMLNWYSMWNSGRGVKARKEYSTFVSSIIISGIKELK